MKTRSSTRMKIISALIIVCLSMGLNTIQAQTITDGGDDQKKTAAQTSAIESNPFLSLNKWDYFLYPVPARDEVNIKVTKGHAIIRQINIVDEFGNAVLEIDDLSTEKIKLNVSDLPPGQYYMQVRPDQDGEVKMKRFYVAN